MRTFRIFGITDGGSAAFATDIKAMSPEQACLMAANMCSDFAQFEIWESAVLISRSGSERH